MGTASQRRSVIVLEPGRRPARLDPERPGGRGGGRARWTTSTTASSWRGSIRRVLGSTPTWTAPPTPSAPISSAATTGIGVNYYNEPGGGHRPLLRACSRDSRWFDFVPAVLGVEPRAPTGIYERHRSSPPSTACPSYITENGTLRRAGWWTAAPTWCQHLTLARTDAIEWGSGRAGLLRTGAWVDNYEWNHGFDLRFGLYELDAETKGRVPRPVVELYRDVAKRNGIDE